MEMEMEMEMEFSKWQYQMPTSYTSIGLSLRLLVHHPLRVATFHGDTDDPRGELLGPKRSMESSSPTANVYQI